MINKYPFLIAEISANHTGSIKKALKLIDTAKNSGADAVKLQTFDPNMMTINSSDKKFIIKNGIWRGYKYWDLYKKAQTPFEWHHTLFNYAKKIKIKIFSSPFSERSVDFLENFNCPAYKIASFEMCDVALIKYIAKKNKPLILSTGTQTIENILMVHNYLKKLKTTHFFIVLVNTLPLKMILI